MKSTVAFEHLSSFISKTSIVNYVFTVLLSFLLVNASVSLTSIYLTAYGLNSRNATKHINVGLQILQLVCVTLNWATGKWVNTLFAGILSLEFVIYFVTSIVLLKVPSEKRTEFVLYGIFETATQCLIFLLLFTVEIISLLFLKVFPAKPVILGISSHLLAFADTDEQRTVFVSTIGLFLIGVAVHLYTSSLFID